eukprot:3501043-Rhodomonas_salina.1
MAFLRRTAVFSRQLFLGFVAVPGSTARVSRPGTVHSEESHCENCVVNLVSTPDPALHCKGVWKFENDGCSSAREIKPFKLLPIARRNQRKLEYKSYNPTFRPWQPVRSQPLARPGKPTPGAFAAGERRKPFFPPPSTAQRYIPRSTP